MITLREDATPEQRKNLEDNLARIGLSVHPIEGTTLTVLAIIGEEAVHDLSWISGMEGVAAFQQVNHPFKLVRRSEHPEYGKNGDTRLVRVGNAVFGGEEAVVIGGPCTVYTLDQTRKAVELAAEAGAKVARGGAWKPRTGRHSFTGLKERGLDILYKAAQEFGVPFVTEALDPRDVPYIAQAADIIQIGERNMYNTPLLEEAGRSGKPVLLKRMHGATIEEWLQAADKIAGEGNYNIILCERGVRTLSDGSIGGRFNFDAQALVAARMLSFLPVICDPSHATGKREYVIPIANAALAGGAHGLEMDVLHDEGRSPIIEYKNEFGRQVPTEYIDYAQGLTGKQFRHFMDGIRERKLDRVQPLHELIGI